MPPEDTVSEPPLFTVSFLALPATTTISFAPNSKRVPVAMPPANTVSVPPLTVVSTAEPPEETASMPASVMSIAMPPENTPIDWLAETVRPLAGSLH